MPRHECLVLLLGAAAGAIGIAAQDSAKPQLTARELFYSAASDPAAKKTDAKSEPQAPPKTESKPKAEAKAPPKAPPKTVVAKRALPSTTPAASTSGATASLPGGGHVLPAVASTAPAPATGTALGLKYTILKLSGGQMVPVAPDTVFHAGDRIQFDVQTNGPGYLYIVSQGSSGTWKPMFPSPEVEDGNNRVDGWRKYTLPPGSRMMFDEQTGVEKIFIVFSREPEAGLENMIYSLQVKKPRTQEPPPKKLVEIAQANIDDATVGRLREAYARDLIIERVNDKTPADQSAADKNETAVYVVNATGGTDSRVVADLRLVHQ
jgi:hypothetical protein